MEVTKMTFDEFVALVTRDADSVIKPTMTSFAMNSAMQELAWGKLWDFGGAHNLLAAYPELLNVRMCRADFAEVSTGADAIGTVAVVSLLSLMAEVKNRKIGEFFSDGETASLTTTLSFVHGMRDHVRGLLTPTRVDNLEAALSALNGGDVEASAVSEAIKTSGHVLRLLSMNPGGETIRKVGGENAVRHHLDVIEKHAYLRQYRDDFRHKEVMASPAIEAPRPPAP